MTSLPPERSGLDAAHERLSGMPEPAISVDAALAARDKQREREEKAGKAAMTRLEADLKRVRERRHEKAREEEREKRLAAEMERMKERQEAQSHAREVGRGMDEKIERAIGKVRDASKGR